MQVLTPEKKYWTRKAGQNKGVRSECQGDVVTYLNKQLIRILLKKGFYFGFEIPGWYSDDYSRHITESSEHSLLGCNRFDMVVYDKNDDVVLIIEIGNGQYADLYRRVRHVSDNWQIPTLGIHKMQDAIDCVTNKQIQKALGID